MLSGVVADRSARPWVDRALHCGAFRDRLGVSSNPVTLFGADRSGGHHRGRAGRTQRDEALRAFIVAKREAAGLRQVDIAARLGRYQSYVSHVESGQKVMDVVELMEWAEAIGFDPAEAIRHLAAVEP
jgi:hypothetical protein